jgi:hypothetical protein
LEEQTLKKHTAKPATLKQVLKTYGITLKQFNSLKRDLAKFEASLKAKEDPTGRDTLVHCVDDR